jgi:hypothetical protein
VEIMGGKFSHMLEAINPWMLLNRNFLKEELALSPSWLGIFLGLNIFQTAFWTVYVDSGCTVHTQMIETQHGHECIGQREICPI